MHSGLVLLLLLGQEAACSANPADPSESFTEDNVTSLSCSKSFDVNLFKIFFDESCLVALSSEDACMIDTVGAFLKELLGELQVLSVAMAPCLLYFYVTLALLGNVPKVVQGTARCTKFFYLLWLVLQICTCFFQLLSLLWYALGYANVHRTMGECFTKVGSAFYMDLTILPAAGFQMAAVNKMAPLLITLQVILMEQADHSDRRATIASRCVWGLLAIPFVIGTVYFVGTLSVWFSLVFLPLPIVMVVVAGLGVLGLGWMARIFEQPLTWLKERLNLDLVWPGNHPLLLIAFAALLLMIVSPLVVLGTILSFAVYAGMDAGEVIVWTYEYCFTPAHFVFRMPSFADFEVLFRDFPTSLWRTFTELNTFLEMPADQVLLIGITAGVFGTVLNILRSFIFTLNSLLLALSRDSCGVDTKSMRDVKWGL